MAFNHVIRRVSASKVVPLAIRAAAGGCRRFHLHSSAILSSAGKRSIAGSGKFFNRSLPSAIHHYSSRRGSDEALISVLEDEIQCAKETDGADKVEEIPKGFPFKVDDQPGQNSVILSREYQGEKITVEVGMPSLVTGEEEEDAGDDDNDDEGSNSSSAIPLVVRVSRNKGRDLEFGCTAYADEISIDSLSLKDPEKSEDQLAYEGPDFLDLDENLQKAFHKYLEIRGVNPSTTNFLHEFMINKDSREYLLWLNNIKQFIES